MNKNVRAPGVVIDRVISNARDWCGKYKEAEDIIKSKIPSLQKVSIAEGTRGRPVDSIFVLVDPDGEQRSQKSITRKIEVLLKTMLNLVIDYRVVSIE